METFCPSEHATDPADVRGDRCGENSDPGGPTCSAADVCTGARASEAGLWFVGAMINPWWERPEVERLTVAPPFHMALYDDIGRLLRERWAELG
ncbi:MAG TPA: hypothetical protein PKA64_22080 [Myxococcota bacterium]|nr:hypothetical protein [Myxococcota bacterium]